ncbi:MAG: hypothetical protein OEX07_17255 [Gammaproteobacteria bacterium]|nr:hypothetical protein [Gammaproteobacteria bacterium]
MKNKICSDCGYIGKPDHDEYTSIILDVFAWSGSLIIATITGIIFFALIGPLFTIWHISTFRSHRCPHCGNWEMHRIQKSGNSHSHIHS